MTERKSAKSSTTKTKRYEGFSNEEKGAMQDRVQEMKATKQGADGDTEVLAKIAEMREPDRGLARRLHAVIRASVPSLSPKLWYGMPAYAKDGSLVCHFQPAQKFKTRYATLGFSDKARLDNGTIWPVAYALTKLNSAEEATIVALVKKAVS